MKKDPIVEETRQQRDEYASQFHYDLRAMVEDLKKKELRHAERVVSLKDQAHREEANI